MAYIAHRCGCGHLDTQHNPSRDPNTPNERGACTADAGRACHGTCEWGAEPEVYPTFNLKRQPIERIVVPGTRYGAEAGGVPTCGCDNCKALYAELSAA